MLEPEKRPSPPECPECGAGDAIPIVYGMPAGSDPWEEERRGEIEIGGCVVSPGVDPAWRCRTCGGAFGTHADDEGLRA